MKADGFIFNLGHGVFPDVNPETLKKLTAFVHEYSAAKNGTIFLSRSLVISRFSCQNQGRQTIKRGV